MFKPKVKPVEPVEEPEEEEEMEEELEEESEEPEPKTPAGINKTFQRKEESEDTPKITRMEVLDMIDGHVIRIKQLLDLIKE